MTLLRLLALKISHTVVRFASPGSKEWAQGLAAEVAFVQGDWAALGWALGSARVLLDYRETPIASLTDLASAAEKYATSIYNGIPTPIWSPIWSWFIILPIVLIPGDDDGGVMKTFFHPANRTERVGCGLAVLGLTAAAISRFLEWRGRRPVPPPTDDAAVLRFYKAGLERVRDFPRSPRGWLWGFGLTTLFVGWAMAPHGGFCAHLIFDVLLGLSWAVTMWLRLLEWRITRRRLERLKALLAEKP